MWFFVARSYPKKAGSFRLFIYITFVPLNVFNVCDMWSSNFMRFCVEPCHFCPLSIQFDRIGLQFQWKWTSGLITQFNYTHSIKYRKHFAVDYCVNRGRCGYVAGCLWVFWPFSHKFSVPGSMMLVSYWFCRWEMHCYWPKRSRMISRANQTPNRP